MHETALMQNLIAIADQKIQEHHVKRVKRVILSVGRLSNAMPDALSFAFDAMTQSGPLKGAKLEMREVPVEVCCETCGEKYTPPAFPFICPECKSPFYSIIRGEDIYIESLDCEI
jgi:hydrogenase nickel insertion protein HypA